MSDRESRRRGGCDDDYGYKNQDRVAEGDPHYYRNEREHHDEDYHEDRKNQEEIYHNTGFGQTTERTQSDLQEFYPKRGDSREFKRYLEHARTSLVTNSDWYEGAEKQRAEATSDNRDADRARRQNGIRSEDYAYPENHTLRTGYRTAKNRRDNVLTGEGPGTQELDSALPDRRHDPDRGSIP